MPRDRDELPSLPENTTSIHVRQALQGEMESLAWIVTSFSALLLAQARYRLPKEVRGTCEPEDLVSEVWAIALAKLRGLTARDGRFTPVVLKFLSTILLRRANRIALEHVRRQRGAPAGGAPARAVSTKLDELPSPMRDVVSGVVHQELTSLVMAEIEALEPKDREVIVLRAIEQRTGDEVARLLGSTRNAIHTRYHRAIGKLRSRLSPSVLDELDDLDDPPSSGR